MTHGEETRTEIVRLRSEFKSYAVIGRRLNVCHATIWRVCVSHGLVNAGVHANKNVKERKVLEVVSND